MKPIRDKSTTKLFREKWWQYGRPRPALQAAKQELAHVFVVSRVYTHWIVAKYRSDVLFSEGTVVFAKSDYYFFAIIQSVFHELWAKSMGSSLGAGGRYTPTDCFLTFPFPVLDEDIRNRLTAVGLDYINVRDEICDEEKIGYSDLYNQVHDVNNRSQNVERFRDVKRQLDCAVAESFDFYLNGDNLNFLERSGGSSFVYDYDEKTKTSILRFLRERNDSLWKNGE